MARRLSWQTWADFGQARDAQNGGKIAQNLVPKWGQDGAKMTQEGACLAILRPIGELSWAFWGSFGTIFAEMAEV